MNLQHLFQTEILTSQNTPVQWNDYQGSYIIVYFYPKDSTPGCTIEGLEFTKFHAEFAKYNCKILGVSKDSCASHAKFIAKQNFSFELLSDSQSVLCDLFGVTKSKSMFGKIVNAIDRSTFLISPDGTLIKEWRNVSVKGHVAEVLEALQSFAKSS
jgi:thioredoxin-dependent peroxiredoxin